MSEEPRLSVTAWPGLHDWLRIFGAVRMALHPAKLVLALAALVLTFAWGTVLDGVWKLGGRGADGIAIARYVNPESATAAELLAAAIESAAPGGMANAGTPTAEADHGIFQLWREHTLSHIQGALRAVIDLDVFGSGSVHQSLGMLCHGTRWLVSEHFFFAILFLLGTLAIWSLFGAAICRIAAVQFAREEKIGITDALQFAKKHFLSGFFVTPLLPVLIMLGVGLLLAISGFFLWIPGIGNFFSVFFFLALLGGLAMACVMLGCAGGGSFFWPTVAVEGSDGFDAISRSFSYFFGKPVKTVFYGLTALFWGGICWLVLKFVLHMTLRITHACVSCGMSGFGTGWWGAREGAGEGVTKLDALWPTPVFGDLYRMGDRSQMGGWEIVAAIFVGVWVLLAIGWLWAFLVSYYFSSSTIVYYLLRRDVDATDHEEVYIEEEPEAYAEPMEPPVQETPPPPVLPEETAEQPEQKPEEPPESRPDEKPAEPPEERPSETTEEPPEERPDEEPDEPRGEQADEKPE